MNELRSMTTSLSRQKRRLLELIEISGGLDPEHPLQRFSLRRIEWLENKIEQTRRNENDK